MSKLNCLFAPPNPVAFGGTYGFSKDAELLKNQTEQIKRHMAATVTFGDHVSQMMEALFAAGRRASLPNWDGNQAEAMTDHTLQNAQRFILSLPYGIPVPEVYVEPDGEIAFEWNEGKRQVFSVSVGRDGRLSYAGLFGANKTYGVEYFFDEIPRVVLDNIHRLLAESWR